jgi:C-terminal processing protease CtpA/Prc
LLLLAVLAVVFLIRVVCEWPKTDDIQKANAQLLSIHNAARQRGDLNPSEVVILDHYLGSTQAVLREIATLVAADAASDSSRRAVQASVIQRLKDPSPDVRKEALATLESFDDRRVIPAMQALLEDPDPAVASEARSLTENFGQKRAGIGVAVGKRGDDLVVGGVFPGSPAAVNGMIHTGDKLISIRQSNQPPVQVQGFDISQAVRLLRGAKGTEVTVEVTASDSNNARVVTLVREEFRRN